MSMSATGPPFFRQARPSVSHLVDSARPRSTSLRFADPLEDKKDQEDGLDNNVHMEEDEEDHDGNYGREVDEESDEGDKYDLEDDREEEIANGIQNPRVIDNIEPVEDHNEAQFSEVQNENQE